MRRLGHFIALSVVAAAPVSLGTGCDSAPATAFAPAAPAPALEVVWSPAEGLLPFPDAVFLDERAQGVLPPDTTLDPVRRALLAFTAEHEGATADTVVAFELTAPVDVAALAASVALLRDDGSRVQADVVPTLFGKGALLRPRAPLVPGERYTAVVVAGLRGAGGESVVRSRSFAYVAGDGVGKEELPGGRATADKLDRLVDVVAPALAVAEAAGIARDDVMVASQFTVTDLPTVVLDVTARQGPWPSDFLRDADGRTTLPPTDLSGMLDPAQLAVTASTVAAVPGFSTSARVRVPLSGRADDVSAGYALYALGGAPGAAPALVDGTSVTLSADASTVFLQKKPALLPARDYALVVTRDARAAGRAILPSLDAALLLVDAPLAVDGHATTAVLDDDHARALEPERLKLGAVVDAVGRERVTMAVPFTTMDSFAYVDEKVQLAAGVSPAVHDVVVANPWDRGLYAVMPNVDTVVSGTFTSLDFIDPVTLRADAPRSNEVPFVLSLPPPRDDGQPVPVVIFGHGLITAKELSYLIADQLAQAGFATFAIDLPMHGERTVCLVDAHCDLFQTCGDDHQCKKSDGSPGSLASGDSPFDGGPRIPLATGEAFVLVGDLVASRDHFMQGIIDLRQGLRMIQSGALDDTQALAHDHFGWLGISLGGIYGAMMSGSTTDIDSFVLNVPGADLVVTLEDSTVLHPLLQAEIDKRNVDPTSEAYKDFEDAAHLVLDPVDPLNLAPRATVDCPAGWEQKRVVLQMADTDLIVPNTATRALSAAMDVGVSEYHPLVSNHGFLLDPTSFEGAAARDQAVQFLLGP